ncbi:MAG: hypothetical protein KGL74_14760, partial [Elusimicrobia bacterium]|nr:hypothetical protein [Elusimicrobiota bacterium]
MTASNPAAPYGRTCLTAALVLTASWIPALGLLDGAEWATPRAAHGAHFLGLAFLIGWPLILGARLWRGAPPDERAERARDWAARCLLPALLFAVAIQAVLLVVPHVTAGVIVGLMFAGLPL